MFPNESRQKPARECNEERLRIRFIRLAAIFTHDVDTNLEKKNKKQTNNNG